MATNTFKSIFSAIKTTEMKARKAAEQVNMDKKLQGLNDPVRIEADHLKIEMVDGEVNLSEEDEREA